MTEHLREKIDIWKRANNAAREAEHTLALEWERFYSLGGRPPDKKLVKDVSKLRDQANKALAAAVAAMDVARQGRT